MQVRDRLLAVLAADVGGDVVHRAGPVQRDHRREVVDRGRAQLANVAPHARRLELEDAGRLARGEQLERPGVVERDPIEIDGDPAVRGHELHRLAEDRQVREAQEVELEQAERLDRVHLVLGHERFRVRGLLERHELGQRLATDDHPGGVRRRVARHPLELLGQVDEAVDASVRLVRLAERWRDVERLVEPDPELIRDGLRDPVDLAVAVAQHAADVADRGPGEHRAEGDDLGDVVGAVLAGDVRDDLVPATVLEVDVDVGHRDPVLVEEALEGQLIVDRVDRRDAERVGHDRARRAAPAGRLDALLAGEAHEIGHDQEVAGVAHGGDDPELVVEPLLERPCHGPVATLEPALAFGPQPALGGLALGHRKVRDERPSERQLDRAHVGDPAAGQQRVPLIGEQRGHLRGALEIEVLRFEAHPAGRVEIVAGANAQQHVVRIVLVLADIVQVVGHNERQAGLRRQPHELLVQPPLLGQPVVLELEEEPIRPEDVAVLAREPARSVPLVDLERARDLAVETGTEPDQARAVPGQVLTVDPGLVVIAVDVGVGHEPAQVAVADRVAREQDQVVGLAIGLALLVGHRPTGDVGLDADDRLDALRPAGLVEGHRAVQGPVVGQREAVESVRGGRVHQLRDSPEPVEQAELGMDVEVGEISAADGHGTSIVARDRWETESCRGRNAGRERPARAPIDSDRGR